MGKLYHLSIIIHALYMTLSIPGKYSSTDLVSKGLAEINENPALMTDMGMKAMGQVFPNLTALTVYNCPHLRYPRGWLDVGKPFPLFNNNNDNNMDIYIAPVSDAYGALHILPWL